MLAERRLDRLRLGAVVQRRGGAMGVHVGHVARLGPGVLQRQLDRAPRAAALGLRRGQVVRVRGRGVALQHPENACAALTRRRLLLEHQHAGALTEHEPVAAPVEGARYALLRERLHLREAGDRERSERRLGAAGHGAIGVAVCDQPRRHADRVSARGARRHRAERLAAQPVLHRDDPTRRVRHQDRDAERGHLVGTALLHDRVLLLDRRDPADARADHAGGAVRVAGEALLEAGVGERFARGRQGELREAVGAAHLLDRQVLLGLELVAAAEPVLDAGAPRAPALVKRPRPHAERRDRADAGDRDAAPHESFDITRSTA
jgi:hypothetical protein